MSEDSLARLPNDDNCPPSIVLHDSAAAPTSFGAEEGLGSVEQDPAEYVDAYNVLATAPVSPVCVAPSEVVQTVASSIQRNTDNTYHISASNTYVKDWEAEFLPSVFIDLFPFSRGGPVEKRKTQVSKAACIKHYMRYRYNN